MSAPYIVFNTTVADDVADVVALAVDEAVSLVIPGECAVDAAAIAVADVAVVIAGECTVELLLRSCYRCLFCGW